MYLIQTMGNTVVSMTFILSLTSIQRLENILDYKCHISH